MSKFLDVLKDRFFPYPNDIKEEYPPPPYTTATGYETVTDDKGRRTRIPTFAVRTGGSELIENPTEGPGSHSLMHYRERLHKAALDFLNKQPLQGNGRGRR